ncbi:GntR family transcriptional regulator [Catenuloplanes atrovinosus]|nr:GntR family transcriptional regulator [Catenuloplanes atrovinosus]
MRPARRLTLTDDVYTSVQTLIMDHEVAPGEKINIDALARRLEVSPTPVREALARLESDGLVRKRALAGYTASPLLTRAEFEELIEMRLLLEPAAAAKAGYVDDLRAVADLPASPEAPGFTGIAAFTAQDARFHHRIAELSGNGMLRDAIVRLRAHLHLFRLNFPQSHYGTSAAEHHRIVDAIAAGDGPAAAEAMRDHITAARARHLTYFGS